MPDLDLIKQGEQGRDRRGRFARGPGRPNVRPRRVRTRGSSEITPLFDKAVFPSNIDHLWSALLEDVLGTTVSVAQAKSQFAALVARAEAGETIVVTRSGRAVACLGPLPRRQPIKYGELSGVFLSEDLTIPEEVVRDFEPSK